MSDYIEETSEMVLDRFLFTSESVTEGHPDKVADQISDAILDAIIAQDENARVACETLVTTGLALVAGEFTTNNKEALADIPAIVRRTIQEVGYTDPLMGFDYRTCSVTTALDRQSLDIARGVDRGSPELQGAGDQGMVFGYACKETEELMPLPIMLAHKLTMRLAEVRKKGILSFIRPDGKAQVSVMYEDGKPRAVTTVVVSTQHAPEVTIDTIEEAVREEVIKRVVPEELLTPETRYLVNRTGSFVSGGPVADCGLTGRKVIVDTYGGFARHGGGSFSGKDPSKVDRSGCYYARYVAKNIVAAGLADRCEVQVAYAIGEPKPVGVLVDTQGTEKVPVARIVELVGKYFDFRPGLIARQLDLLRPIYRKTAAYGHFGRNDPDFTWERTDKADLLRAEV